MVSTQILFFRLFWSHILLFISVHFCQMKPQMVTKLPHLCFRKNCFEFYYKKHVYFIEKYKLSQEKNGFCKEIFQMLKNGSLELTWTTSSNWADAACSSTLSHCSGAAAAKPWSPFVWVLFWHIEQEVICSPQCLRCSLRYRGARPFEILKTNRKTLKHVLLQTKRRCRQTRTGVKWLPILCISGGEKQHRKRQRPPEKECDIKAAADSAAACEYFCKELSLLVICYGESK